MLKVHRCRGVLGAEREICSGAEEKAACDGAMEELSLGCLDCWGDMMAWVEEGESGCARGEGRWCGETE